MTRSAGPALRELHDRFGGRIEFVSLYVREAHPGDDYPQPGTTERKIQHARDYAERDGVSWTVAVDDIDGTLHERLDEKPDSAYLVGTDGRGCPSRPWSSCRWSSAGCGVAAAAGDTSGSR